MPRSWEFPLEVFEKVKNRPRKIWQSKQEEQRGLPAQADPEWEVLSPGGLELTLTAEMSVHHGKVHP